MRKRGVASPASPSSPSPLPPLPPSPSLCSALFWLVTRSSALLRPAMAARSRTRQVYSIVSQFYFIPSFSSAIIESLSLSLFRASRGSQSATDICIIRLSRPTHHPQLTSLQLNSPLRANTICCVRTSQCNTACIQQHTKPAQTPFGAVHPPSYMLLLMILILRPAIRLTATDGMIFRLWGPRMTRDHRPAMPRR